MVENDNGARPLEGIRVLELASFFAGPLCGCLLADFGADVIKVEQPGVGDPWRRSGPTYDKTSMSFLKENRNKRCITLNLSTPRGQDLCRRLASDVDVLIENFRAGGLERWGLGYGDLSALNPGLIMVRISGFGLQGDYQKRPAFGTILESMTGFTHINGDPDGTPRQMPLALGDLVTGSLAAYGVLLALRHRDRTGVGQVIDSAICDALFRWAGPEALHYQTTGEPPQRQSGALYHPTTPTTGFFRTSDGNWLFIRCHHSDEAVVRLYRAMDRGELAEDARYCTSAGRQTHAADVRRAVEKWVESWPRNEALRRLQAQGVAAGPVYSVADMVVDPHFQARGIFPDISHPTLGMVATPAVAPRLTATPGSVSHLGPELGEHNEEIYTGLLELSSAELAALKQEGVI